MLYPTPETFGLSFEKQSESIVIDRLEEDYVVGVRGPTDEKDTALVLKSVEVVIREIKTAKQADLANESFDDELDEATLVTDLEAEI